MPQPYSADLRDRVLVACERGEGPQVENAQQAVIEVEELLFRGHPKVVDADRADYFGSIPNAELMKFARR